MENQIKSYDAVKKHSGEIVEIKESCKLLDGEIQILNSGLDSIKSDLTELKVVNKDQSEINSG